MQSRVIAANNIVNALFMVVSSLMSTALFAQGLTIPQLFLAVAMLNIVVMAYLSVRQPEYWRAFISWVKR